MMVAAAADDLGLGQQHVVFHVQQPQGQLGALQKQAHAQKIVAVAAQQRLAQAEVDGGDKTYKVSVDEADKILKDLAVQLTDASSLAVS